MEVFVKGACTTEAPSNRFEIDPGTDHIGKVTGRFWFFIEDSLVLHDRRLSLLMITINCDKQTSADGSRSTVLRLIPKEITGATGSLRNDPWAAFIGIG